MYGLSLGLPKFWSCHGSQSKLTKWKFWQACHGHGWVPNQSKLYSKSTGILIAQGPQLSTKKLYVLTLHSTADDRWYATGTLSTRRLKLAKSFRRISVKYAECRHDDTSHMQSRRHISLHSYHSNARRSRSVPPTIVYTLVLYVTYLSLIIFKIIPHPMTLLIAIPLQVIILHSI
jgi:hypothetical protein